MGNSWGRTSLRLTTVVPPGDHMWGMSPAHLMTQLTHLRQPPPPTPLLPSPLPPPLITPTPCIRNTPVSFVPLLLRQFHFFKSIFSQELSGMQLILQEVCNFRYSPHMVYISQGETSNFIGCTFNIQCSASFHQPI